MTRFLILALVSAASAVDAIVIRDDVDDARYRVPASEFPALVDMPGEGHGVLIASRWVVTAAHVVAPYPVIEEIVLGGIPRNVERVVTHPGFKGQARELFEQALATGDAALLMARVAASDDIALLQLRRPVTDVTPAAVYRDTNEFGQIVKIIGKGATGTGATGFEERSPRRTELRRAFNKITSAHDRWFCYVFDHPSTALPLAGIPGSGDSGGPALIEVKDQWLLAGLASWGPVDGDARAFRPGLYGRTSCNVRLSHYSAWIAGVISAP